MVSVANIEKYVCGYQVISGQQLPKVNQKEGSIVDPLVRVEIYGVPQDQAKEETSHINNNGERAFTIFIQIKINVCDDMGVK